MKPLRHPALSISPASQAQRSLILGVVAACISAFSLNGRTAWKLGAELPWVISLAIAGALSIFGIRQAITAKKGRSPRQRMFRRLAIIVNGLVLTLATFVVGGYFAGLM